MSAVSLISTNHGAELHNFGRNLPELKENADQCSFIKAQRFLSSVPELMHWLEFWDNSENNDVKTLLCS